MPGENANIIEKIKYQFSQVITRYLVRNNLTEEEVASKLGLDKNIAARLLRGYTENFSIETLIAYVEKLHLPLKVKVVEESPTKSTSKNF